LAIVLSVLSFGHCIVCPFFKKGQTIQWSKERTDNAMAKRKDKQYNGQKKGQTIQWPTERTDNTMAKRKDKQYNGQKKEQTILVLSVLSFGHCIVCPFFGLIAAKSTS
jgi:hypothetical protein